MSATALQRCERREGARRCILPAGQHMHVMATDIAVAGIQRAGVDEGMTRAPIADMMATAQRSNKRRRRP